MASKIKTYPINSSGDMIDYPSSWSETSKPVAEKEIQPFEATMSFVRHEQGRSSLRLILMCDQGHIWSLMGQCLDEYVRHAQQGSLRAIWTMAKRGSNYGLLLEKVL